MFVDVRDDVTLIGCFLSLFKLKGEILLFVFLLFSFFNLFEIKFELVLALR